MFDRFFLYCLIAVSQLSRWMYQLVIFETYSWKRFVLHTFLFVGVCVVSVILYSWIPPAVIFGIVLGAIILLFTSIYLYNISHVLWYKEMVRTDWEKAGLHYSVGCSYCDFSYTNGYYFLLVRTYKRHLKKCEERKKVVTDDNR